MMDKVQQICDHMQRVDCNGFTARTATVTMDVRGPKNDFFSVRITENGKLVQQSETRRTAVKDMVRYRFDANDPTLQVYLYTK